MNRRKTGEIVVTGLFAAMITVMTAFICHIPYGANGGYIHFGDAVIYLAAAFLPKPYALAAAAIGGGLADLLTAPMWAPATVIIKMLIVLPFTGKREKILVRRNIAAPFLCGCGFSRRILCGRGRLIRFLYRAGGIPCRKSHPVRRKRGVLLFALNGNGSRPCEGKDRADASSGGIRR